jgi:hypothetical protein
MLSEAVAEIRRAEELEAERRQRLRQRKDTIQRLDGWLDAVEDLLEQDRHTVPEALVGEIGDFVQRIDPKLQQSLLRNRTREAAEVLDVLFEAQEAVM